VASAIRVGRKTKTSDQSHERKSQVLFCTLSTSCRSRSALKNQTFDLIATCAFGLEAVVRRELRELGIDSTIGESGRIHFRGDATIICQTNLWLRTADRILIRVSEFPAADFDSLFEVTNRSRGEIYFPAMLHFLSQAGQSNQHSQACRRFSVL